MRLDATSLKPDIDAKRRHLSYAESIAFTVINGERMDYVCTFAPDVGLRVYEADDLSTMIATALSAELMTYRDSHFRPTPAHMQFVSHSKDEEPRGLSTIRQDTQANTVTCPSSGGPGSRRSFRGICDWRGLNCATA